MHMKHPRRYGPRQLAAYAVLSLALSVGAIYSWATFSGIPARDSLLSASGTVEWVQEYRYGIRFALKDVPRRFVYLSKGNAMGTVAAALASNGKHAVTVVYDPKRSGGPLGSSEKYFDVYEISAGGKTVRSHEQVASAWRSDERVGLYLGFAFLLSSVFLGFSALRSAGAT